MRRIKNTMLITVILISLILTLYSQQLNISAYQGKKVLDKETITFNEAKAINILDAEIKTAPISISTNYEKLKDINTKDISEISLSLSELKEESEYIFRKTSNGFICGSTKKTDSSPHSLTKGIVYMIPVIQKLDKSGNVLWKKEYNYKTLAHRLNNLLILEDDSIIFSVQTYPRWDGKKTIYEKSFIIKCDKDGNQLWIKKFDDSNGQMLTNIFLTNKKEIIVVGESMVEKQRIKIKAGKQIEENYMSNDIVITKLDPQGNIIKQKSFGGSDFDNFHIAKYTEDSGIIIKGCTQSSDGEFAIKGYKANLDFVACIDKDLNFKWVVHEKKNQSFIYNQLLLLKDTIYVLGNIRPTANNSTAGFLLILDKDGNEIATIGDIYTEMWGKTLASLENGDVILGCGGQNQGTLIIFDENGNKKKTIEDLKLSPDEIIPTNDGGFIVKAARPIKTISQPLVVSCIWYDMEVVIIKYDSNYKMQWRKTYDHYNDSTRIDLVVPFNDSNVIIAR